MPQKRKTTSGKRAAASAPRGRPRRNTRSTYATPPEVDARPQSEEEAEPAVTEDQPPHQPGRHGPAEVPEPTHDQILQQLQADVLAAQRERDRLAAEAAASSRTRQVSE